MRTKTKEFRGWWTFPPVGLVWQPSRSEVAEACRASRKAYMGHPCYPIVRRQLLKHLRAGK